MATLYVGIDIGAEHNTAHFMAQDGSSVGRLTFPNDLEGAQSLIGRVLELKAAHGTDAVRLGMEATGVYWWHLYHAIVEAPELSGLDVKTAVINPKVVDGFKGIYTDVPKTDLVDAWVIADCVRFGRIRVYPPLDPRYAPLQRLTRLRYQMTHDLTREKNRALSLLFLRFSTYAKDRPFSDVFGAASTAVFTELAVDDIVTMPLEDLAARIMEHGRGHFDDPQAVAKELKQAARRAYRLSPKMDDAVAVTLSLTVANIAFLEKQIACVDRAIAKEMKAFPAILSTVPGIGDVYAAGILAEIGDIHRFPNDNALAKYAGLTWRQHQSGSFEADDLPLTRSGNAYLRYYLTQAANSVRVREPEYAAFYERKYREARHHHHKRALVLTARKLTGLVFALLNEGQIYQPRRNAS
jgi:transposase